MAGESVRALLVSLTSTTGETAEQVYAKWAGLTLGGGEALEGLVRRKLVANGKSSQLRESLTSTLHAGGAIGESPEECLLKTGLTGWS